MSTFTLTTLLVSISALFSYLNLRFVKLPGTIGTITVAIMVSVTTLLCGKFLPGLTHFFITISRDIDYSKTVLDVMLGFLLFAGSLHFDIRKLREAKGPVFLLSTVGVILSTVTFGVLFYWAAHFIGHDIPPVYCFIFGALISPTDPIAVASILKQSRIPVRLQTIISGESLFNDGVGIVLFVTLSEIASQSEKRFTLADTALLFLQEVGGGILLGLGFAILCVMMIRKIDDFQTIMLLTLSLVMGTSVLASLLHVSAPLAVVAAGLYVGNQTFSSTNYEHKIEDILQRVWALLDDILNTILFVLIGMQLVTMPFLNSYWLTGIAAFVIIIFARMLSIGFPITFLRRRLKVHYSTVYILTWAGLRGGISVALALSLPNSNYKEIILAASYFVVILSILGQGLTLNKVSGALMKNNPIA